MKKRKILFILPGFNFGGTVFSTLNMILFLHEKYDITVLPMNPYGPVREKYEEAGIQILVTAPSIMAISNVSRESVCNHGMKCKISFYKILHHVCLRMNWDLQSYIFKKASSRIMKKTRFEFVCSCSEGISTEFASFFNGTKRIAWFRTEYSIWKHQLTDKALAHNKILYPQFDYVVPVSKITRDDFVSYFPAISDRVIPIHNIQMDEQIIEKANEAIDHSFSKDCFNIVSVGRIARQKQFHKIPEIAHKLHDEMGLPIRWYIVGGEGTGSYGEGAKLNEELNKYGNRNYVICVGDKLNPYPYIKSADLLVNTSYYEACPRVVAEAQILHTPVVCANFSSAYEFIQNGVNGYIETIDNLWKPIAKLISDKSIWSTIKAECDSYKIDNQTILTQLEKLFS